MFFNFNLQHNGGRAIKGVARIEGGRLHLKFAGYGTKAGQYCFGEPVVIEMGEKGLQVSVATDINDSEKLAISLEGAKERRRIIPYAEPTHIAVHERDGIVSR